MQVAAVVEEQQILLVVLVVLEVLGEVVQADQVLLLME